jgi:hypothetical protein
LNEDIVETMMSSGEEEKRWILFFLTVKSLKYYIIFLNRGYGSMDTRNL